MKRHLLKVNVYISVNNGEKRADVFTGKLVKSLLIDGNPGLKRLFEKAAGCSPKLIHVTPLYVESSKVKCVHSLRDVNRAGKYTFYVGFTEAETTDSPPFDAVYNAVLNLTGVHRLKNTALSVELLSVETMDVNSLARDVVLGLAWSGKLKIVFASPTLLRDPLKTTKHKSLTPSPMNLFSTPVYVNLYVAGRLKRSTFLRTLLILHRLFSEPYSMYRTVRVVKVRYSENKNPIPALAGYINLFLNKDYYSQYVVKNIDVDLLLSETFTTLITLGTGTSRAAGFGHVTITTPASHSQTT